VFCGHGRIGFLDAVIRAGDTRLIAQLGNAVEVLTGLKKDR